MRGDVAPLLSSWRGDWLRTLVYF